MEDFERLMMQQGVKPMGQAAKPPQARPSQPRQMPQSPAVTVQTVPSVSHGLPAWLSGSGAREMLKNALEMLRSDHAAKHAVSIVMIRQDGTSYRCPLNVSVGELIGRCDSGQVRIAVINGHGWTAVLHPQMGMATIEQDPDQNKEPA